MRGLSHIWHTCRLGINYNILRVQLVILSSNHNHCGFLAGSSWGLLCEPTGLVRLKRHFYTICILDIWLTDLARMKCLTDRPALDDCGCSRCLTWTAIKRRLRQALESCGVASCIGGDVGIIYDERVDHWFSQIGLRKQKIWIQCDRSNLCCIDVVVGDNVCYNLLVLFRVSYWSTSFGLWLRWWLVGAV